MGCFDVEIDVRNVLSLCVVMWYSEDVRVKNMMCSGRTVGHEVAGCDESDHRQLSKPLEGPFT